MVYVVMLFEELARMDGRVEGRIYYGGGGIFKQKRRVIWKWIFDYPMKNNMWSGYYEVVGLNRRKDMFGSIIDFFKKAVMEQVLQDPYWATAALIGEVIFGGRFIVQWIASEYKKRSYVPTAFWFMSLAGSLILLIYSIHIKNPVFMLAFSLNTLIYLRNLHLIRKNAKSISCQAS